MATSRASHLPVPRLNTLAACLALALGAGVASTGAGATPLPRTNHAPAGSYQAATTASAHRMGTYNRPNASRRTHPTHSPLSVTTTTVVTTCADSGAGSLRDVTANANAGDTVDMTQLTCSTITLTSGSIGIAAANVTLQGPGQQSLTISGNGSSQIFSSYGGNLTIDGLTLTDGSNANGGCLYAYGNLLISNSTITGCVANDASQPHSYGGAIDAIGDLTLINSTVSGNTAEGDSAFGGAIYVYGAGTTIQNSVISDNAAIAHGTTGALKFALGGGLAAIYGLEVSGSTIEHNRAVADVGLAIGGGVHFLGALYTGNSANISRSTVTGNVAHSNSDTFWAYGGGLAGGMSGVLPLIKLFYPRSVSFDIGYSTISDNEASSDCASCVVAGGGVNTFGQINLDHSTVSNNRAAVAAQSSATAYGGGLLTRFNQDGSAAAAGRITVSESTISGNSAIGRAGSQGGYGRGGGVAALLSPTVIDNSTVAFNIASVSGGGVMLSSAANTLATLHSSIIANNTAPQAPDLGLAAPFGNGGGVTVNGDHNLILAASTNLALPADTISADPQLKALDHNGGPTKTHMPWPTSPVIGAGSNPNGDTCDQRGVPYARASSGGVDIGAIQSGMNGGDTIFVNGFELESCTPPPPP